MEIYLDNINPDIPSGQEGHHEQFNIIDYVIMYRFQGGPEQPIRYLEMKVNKNDIDTAHPGLIDMVVEGKTRMWVNAVGGGTFVITKIWLTDNTYDLVATGIEVTLNTATIDETLASSILSTTRDPPKVANAIFQSWKSTLDLSGSSQGDMYDDGFEIYFSPSVSLSRQNHPDYTVSTVNALSTLTQATIGQIALVSTKNRYYKLKTTPPTSSANWELMVGLWFKTDMPVLVAINMCALMDGAFVFFANKEFEYSEGGHTVKKMRNCLYYVKYEDINPLAYNPGSPRMNGIVNAYPQMISPDLQYSEFDIMMFKRLNGVASKNSEGSETIINNQIVSIDGGYAESINNNSLSMYGDYAGAQVVSDRIVTDNDTGAQMIADNIVRRYKDPTRSITMLLSEMGTTDEGTGWDESIPVFSYALQINDIVNRITLTNEHLCEPVGSADRVDNFMLRLSTFIRYYPEMTTEYTFGVMKETTLSQELANKLTSISGTLADVRFEGDSIASNGIVNVEDIINIIYPSGSVYMSSDNTNPAIKFNTGSNSWESMGTMTVQSATVYVWKRKNF